MTDTPRSFPPGTWALDPKRTSVTVAAKKLGFLKVPATLDVVSGTVEVDAEHAVTNVQVVVDASSYATGNDKRDEHVRSGDFLDVEAYPTISFSAGAVTAVGGSFRAEGTAVVKGSSAPVSLEVTDLEVGDAAASFHATSTLDRHALGVGKMPNFVIAGSLQLTVDASVVLSES